MKNAIGVDPGYNGAIACLLRGEVTVFPLSKHPHEILDAVRGALLLYRRYKRPPRVCVEMVGNHFAGNAVQSSIKLARHCGHIDMAFIACNVTIDMVHPKTWQKRLDITKGDRLEFDRFADMAAYRKEVSRRAQGRKRNIRDIVQALYPDIRVTLKNADAIAIAHWGATA